MLELYYTELETTGLTRGRLRSLEHSVGREMLKKVLKEYHGIKDPLIDTSDSGKPYLSDHSFEFNISHSEGRIVLALSDKPVGIDVERETRQLPSIVKKRFFTKEVEPTVLEWTRFESYCKFTGMGIYGSTYPPADQNVHFKSYHLPFGYIVSVCSHEPKENFPRDIEELTVY